jgi:hypothetical protein
MFFIYPSIRVEIPSHTPILERYKNREMLYRVLYCIAMGGYSTRGDIAIALEMDMSNTETKAVSLRKVARACDTLAYEKMIQQEYGKFWWMSLYRLRLTPAGEKYWKDTYGLSVEESDWDKLIRQHNGADYLEHSSAVLLFAYHARLRGWVARIMPEEDELGTQPDLEIENEEWILYVEVERKASRAWSKQERWCKQYELQREIVVCLASNAGAENFYNRLQGTEYPYYRITSLEHLTQTAYLPERKKTMWLFENIR